MLNAISNMFTWVLGGGSIFISGAIKKSPPVHDPKGFKF